MFRSLYSNHWNRPITGVNPAIRDIAGVRDRSKAVVASDEGRSQLELHSRDAAIPGRVSQTIGAGPTGSATWRERSKVLGIQPNRGGTASDDRGPGAATAATLGPSGDDRRRRNSEGMERRRTCTGRAARSRLVSFLRHRRRRVRNTSRVQAAERWRGEAGRRRRKEAKAFEAGRLVACRGDRLEARPMTGKLGDHCGKAVYSSRWCDSSP